MGWGIKLTDAQWDELDKLRFSTSSADVFRNCLIVLCSDSSETIGRYGDGDTVTVHHLGVQGAPHLSLRCCRPQA